MHQQPIVFVCFVFSVFSVCCKGSVHGRLNEPGQVVRAGVRVRKHDGPLHLLAGPLYRRCPSRAHLQAAHVQDLRECGQVKGEIEAAEFRVRFKRAFFVVDSEIKKLKI